MSKINLIGACIMIDPIRKIIEIRIWFKNNSLHKSLCVIFLMKGKKAFIMFI